MTRRALLLSIVAAAGWPAGPGPAASEEAYERAFFRTFTLLYATAPRATIAAAARCAVAATDGFPETFRHAVIEIDRRPIYRGSDRVQALVGVLAPMDPATTQPLAACFDRLGRDEFGETRGSIPATAAPRPDDVAACPIDVDTLGEDELTCYCQPMLGGIAYGHRTYSDRSSICLAARHAGAMDYLTGGVVRAVFEPGCASYEGTEANGALSAAGDRTARSFHFPIVGAGRCPR